MKRRTDYGVFYGMSREEIAFFVVYKMPTRLPRTRKRIKTELEELGMTLEEAKELVERKKFTFGNEKGACPRCGSHKRVEVPAEEGRERVLESGSTSDVGHCLICDYDPRAEKRESALHALKRRIFPSSRT